MLGSEIWEDFAALLSLVKEFIVDVWEVREKILHGDDSCPGQLNSQSSAGDLGPVAGVGGSGLVCWVNLLIHIIGVG